MFSIRAGARGRGPRAALDRSKSGQMAQTPRGARAHLGQGAGDSGSGGTGAAGAGVR